MRRVYIKDMSSDKVIAEHVVDRREDVAMWLDLYSEYYPQRLLMADIT